LIPVKLLAPSCLLPAQDLAFIVISFCVLATLLKAN
jgi:hypothetical protein